MENIHVTLSCIMLKIAKLKTWCMWIPQDFEVYLTIFRHYAWKVKQTIVQTMNKNGWRTPIDIVSLSFIDDFGKVFFKLFHVFQQRNLRRQYFINVNSQNSWTITPWKVTKANLFLLRIFPSLNLIRISTLNTGNTDQ